MRLWDYRLIKNGLLPQSQLIAQWRELNVIYKSEKVNHILINYVYNYPKADLYMYSVFVIEELERCGFKVKSLENFNNYFKDFEGKGLYRRLKDIFTPFPFHQNNRYLLQCFMNLQEKYDRGQRDFTREQYEKMRNFVIGELYDSMTTHVVELLFLNEKKEK